MEMEVRGRPCSSATQQNGEEMDLRRGPWTLEEDLVLMNYIANHGEGRWNSLAQCAGLRRTGKSCRLRWLNYLKPDVRRGNITPEEQLLILELHARWGNRWSKIAQHLPGRTDNEIKNYWRTRVQKHAKQLNCDVDSKKFKDFLRYLWIPRLIERIHATGGGSPFSTECGKLSGGYQIFGIEADLSRLWAVKHSPAMPDSTSYHMTVRDVGVEGSPANSSLERGVELRQEVLALPNPGGYSYSGMAESENYKGFGEEMMNDLWSMDDIWYLQH